MPTSCLHILSVQAKITECAPLIRKQGLVLNRRELNEPNAVQALLMQLKNALLAVLYATVSSEDRYFPFMKPSFDLNADAFNFDCLPSINDFSEFLHEALYSLSKYPCICFGVVGGMFNSYARSTIRAKSESGNTRKAMWDELGWVTNDIWFRFTQVSCLLFQRKVFFKNSLIRHISKQETLYVSDLGASVCGLLKLFVFDPQRLHQGFFELVGQAISSYVTLVHLSFKLNLSFHLSLSFPTTPLLLSLLLISFYLFFFILIPLLRHMRHHQ